jgi:hypothetical protein
MAPPSTTSRSSFVAGAVPGVALGAASALAGFLRRDKALHPIGHHGAGQLRVTDPDPDLGIAAFSEVDDLPCEARWSRSMGLPTGWPDIEGLALRLPGCGPDGADADLLFASTGTHAWSRYLLTVRPPGRFGLMTTLLPVRAGGRAVTFRVTPVATSRGVDDLPPTAYDLAVARGNGPWRPLGTIDVAWSRSDTDQRFDPVARPLEGIEQFAFVSALREPAYVAARSAAHARARRT